MTKDIMTRNYIFNCAFIVSISHTTTINEKSRWAHSDIRTP